METMRRLLISGSLVRAQQAEPNNQQLTDDMERRLVLNLEPGSKLISDDREAVWKI